MFNVCCRKYSLLFSLVNRNSFELKFAEKITTTVSFALHFFYFQRSNIPAFGIFQKYF